MSEQPQQKVLNLQECLALERTTLANERTFLSYARTAIMIFITGVTVFKLFPNMIIIFIMGWVAVVVSTILFFVGMGKYMKRFGSLSSLSAGCMNPNKAEKKE
jgi:putative membrane protein